MCSTPLSKALSVFIIFHITLFLVLFCANNYVTQKKKSLSFEFVQEDHTRTSKGRREGLSRREKRKTSRVVLKTFFSRAFEEGFFFARREEEEEEEEVVHSLVRVIFFFSQRGVQKRVLRYFFFSQRGVQKRVLR